MQIVLATHNAHKCAELQALLEGTSISVRSLGEFSRESPPETGLTFVENALIKARHATRVSGLAAIADDSGLVVDALRGAPGIYSARYAGSGASDRANLDKVLEALRNISDDARTARYHCALVYLRFEHDPAPIVCHAAWEGRILRASQGNGGFGYDPIFEVRGLNQSAAELSREHKNRISHRGVALTRLLAALRDELSTRP
jgi:XTP/dITP diphosphohydrolase